MSPRKITFITYQYVIDWIRVLNIRKILYILNTGLSHVYAYKYAINRIDRCNKLP